MKNIKKIVFALTGVLLLTALASCGGGSNSSKEEYPNVSEDSSYSKDLKLLEIMPVTTNTKTVFYVGEEFDSTGLVVKATYVNEGKRTDKEITNYSLDSSAFDSRAVGSADILVSYREGGVVVSSYYTVKIKSSLFESTAGLTYAAGLKATFTKAESDNPLVKTMDLKTPYTFNPSLLNYTLVENTVGNDGSIVAVEKQITSRSVVVTQSIDTNKVGVYAVKITYTGPKVNVGGVEYDNKVTSFVLVNVRNTATAITKTSTDDTTFEASTDVLDVSAWKFKITRKVDDGEEIVNFNDDMFTVEGVNPLVAGDYVATVKLKALSDSGTTISTKVNVKIVESTKYNIVIETDLEHHVTLGEGTSSFTTTDLVTGGVLTHSGKTEKEGQYPVKTDEKTGTNCYGWLKVDSIAKNSYLTFHMNKPGVIVIFVSTNAAGDVRGFSLTCEAAEYEMKYSTTAVQQTPTRYEFVVSEAGDYVFTADEKTVNVHGFIIAVGK